MFVKNLLKEIVQMKPKHSKSDSVVNIFAHSVREPQMPFVYSVQMNRNCFVFQFVYNTHKYLGP